jgi:lipopolysaccharide transport system ATP-binding protein
MPNTVISVEDLSKSYQLGIIGTGTFRGDAQSWWAKLRGLPDPHLKIGEKDHGNRQGETLWALKDVNFEVQQGEALGIIGRNGAGKSTLLKILSRVTAPTSGEVKVKGRIASLLEVGTGFHPELTGRENIYLNGAILGMKKAEIARKFDEIVDFSGVEQFIDTPVKRYSSGMYVRLAFAVAAHLEPEILIVDEVLAVGDAEFQKKCLGKMSDVAHEGRTVLFVSHNMAAVRNLCSSCIILKKGEISIQGPVETTINNYLNSEALEFSPFVQLPKGELGMPAEGKSIQFMSQDGISKAIFKLREPWKIIYKFEVFKYTKQIVAGFHLLNNESTTVMTFLSAPQDLEAGNYQVEFLVDIHLASCQLNFVAFLLIADRTIYWQRNVGDVSISDAWVGSRPRLSTSAHGMILTNQNELIKKSEEKVKSL